MTHADISIYFSIVLYEAFYLYLNFNGVNAVFIISRKNTQASRFIDDIDVHKPRFS
jgi:hypothetical protein